MIGGHSAGSHLCSMLFHSHNNWIENEPNLRLVHALVHISGVFDLAPLVGTYVNDPLMLNSYVPGRLLLNVETYFKIEINCNIFTGDRL